MKMPHERFDTHRRVRGDRREGNIRSIRNVRLLTDTGGGYHANGVVIPPEVGIRIRIALLDKPAEAPEGD